MRAIALAFALAAALAVAGAAHAGDWDATWAGGFEDGGDGVQVIVLGDQVLGFFYSGDYLDLSDPGSLAADGTITFRWDGGEGTLAGTGDDRTLTIRSAGKPDRVIALKRDQ
jgi:hypothetical protein